MNMNMTELEIEEELDQIYDLEDLIIDGRFETLDVILSLVDAENIDAVFLMGFVIVSRLAAEHLTNRDALLEVFHRRFPEYKDMK
jgi:hypothetical protein